MQEYNLLQVQRLIYKHTLPVVHFFNCNVCRCNHYIRMLHTPCTTSIHCAKVTPLAQQKTSLPKNSNVINILCRYLITSTLCWIIFVVSSSFNMILTVAASPLVSFTKLLFSLYTSMKISAVHYPHCQMWSCEISACPRAGRNLPDNKGTRHQYASGQVVIAKC